ncbi:MAG: hypothetical protein Athens041674_824 [Parcubacteria group bacterium Athens0416_74]|nr:MAG: hypothetical protein Athens041674_824 [Parcubacteria group bacterium Athens0416_74]
MDALKYPNILMVGASAQSHRLVTDSLKSSLWGPSMPWNPAVNACGSFIAALAFVRQRPGVDIVHIGNTVCMTAKDLRGGCQALALSLSAQRRATWVAIDAVEDPEPAQLVAILEAAGVRAFASSLHNVILAQAQHRAQYSMAAMS